MKVKFVPQNVEVEIKPNQSILDIANEHSIYIKSVCRGVPSCAECRVRVIDGEYNVFPPSQKELALIGTAYFVDQRRLSCQLKCFGNITIDLTEQVEKESMSPTKRPRGGQKDTDDSKARTGNIIFEEQSEHMRKEDEKRRRAEDLYEKEEQKRELERIRSRHHQKPGTPNPEEGGHNE